MSAEEPIHQQNNAELEAKIVKCRDVTAEGRALAWTEEMLRESLKDLSPAQVERKLDDCLKKAVDVGAPVDPAAVERGRILYSRQGCAGCHGKSAGGGERGPNLLSSRSVMRDKSGESIGEVVLRGVPNTPMPAFPLQPDEIADLAQFLHSLRNDRGEAAIHTPPSILTGNVTEGRIYFERNCSGCHSVKGDLAGIGDRIRDSQALQQRWLMPKNVLATATVHGRDNSTFIGQVLHVDEFKLVMRHSDGRLKVVQRSGDQPKIVLQDPLTGHRSLLTKYSDQDIHNVTAYLASLTHSRSNVDTLDGKSDSLARGDSEAISTHAADAGLTPERMINPMPGSWPTYSGDYSGRRYSPLTQIDQSNVRQLALAWTVRLTAGTNYKGVHPLIIAGEEQQGDSATATTANVRGAVLQVNGVLYVSSPDNVWAVDAREGQVLWHFIWKSRGGTPTARGLGMWGHYLYIGTSDANLVAIDARTGHARWHVKIARFEDEYWATPAPVVVGNHVLVGTGNVFGVPGFVKSFDAEDGELQWTHYNVPMNAGDPGLETWKDLEAARRGGGLVWVPGSYDPETNLYIYGTGNPMPTYTADARGNGDALYTCSIIAVNVETGKRAWHYQISPNDTHDWDAGLTPVLADLTINRKPRKLVLVAGRNGYFFVIDRRSGEHVLTSKYSTTANWALPDLNKNGQPMRIPEKDHLVSGALVSPSNQGTANWYPASFSPDYGLFYFQSAESWAVNYTTEADPLSAASYLGKAELAVDSESYLRAIDPRTGQTAWSIQYPTRGRHGNFGMLGQGVLTTAGRLLFADDTVGNLVARDPGNGKPLWHINLGKVSNAPQTYMLDGRQYILVAAGDVLYAFKLPEE